jgi:hypothetical protein
MYDEPNQAEFPALHAWSQSIAARAPGKLRFINLLRTSSCASLHVCAWRWGRYFGATGRGGAPPPPLPPFPSSPSPSANYATSVGPYEQYVQEYVSAVQVSTHHPPQLRMCACLCVWWCVCPPTAPHCPTHRASLSHPPCLCAQDIDILSFDHYPNFQDSRCLCARTGCACTPIVHYFAARIAAACIPHAL